MRQSCSGGIAPKTSPRRSSSRSPARWERCRSPQIADRLRLSLGTVKIRLHRARAVLYAELRRSCLCYRNERGELMGERRDG